MTLTLPRISRDAAYNLAERRALPLHEIHAAMPDRLPEVWFSPVGGARISEDELLALRDAMLELAREHGMPARPTQAQQQSFEGRAARLIHDRLPLSEHEASQDDGWAYLTCCWLMDVAVWRFDHDASPNRFIGHLNRNTFRRMWWRQRVLGEAVDLTLMREDELVNIMERTTLASNRPLARTIATVFLSFAATEDVNRMVLMRDATKRILRLTPFVAFEALDAQSLDSVVRDAFEAARAGMAGERFTMPIRVAPGPVPPSDAIVDVPSLSVVAPRHQVPGAAAEPSSEDFEEVARAALQIARRTGRVTNASLREVVAITADEAREVFLELIERGELVRRGVKRGTHYVLNENVGVAESDTESEAGEVMPVRTEPGKADSREADETGGTPDLDDTDPNAPARVSSPPPDWRPPLPMSTPPPTSERDEALRIARQGAETALRRLLRRRS